MTYSPLLLPRRSSLGSFIACLFILNGSAWAQPSQEYLKTLSLHSLSDKAEPPAPVGQLLQTADLFREVLKFLPVEGLVQRRVSKRWNQTIQGTLYAQEVSELTQKILNTYKEAPWLEKKAELLGAYSSSLAVLKRFFKKIDPKDIQANPDFQLFKLLDHIGVSLAKEYLLELQKNNYEGDIVSCVDLGIMLNYADYERWIKERGKRISALTSLLPLFSKPSGDEKWVELFVDTLAPHAQDPDLERFSRQYKDPLGEEEIRLLEEVLSWPRLPQKELKKLHQAYSKNRPHDGPQYRALFLEKTILQSPESQEHQLVLEKIKELPLKNKRNHREVFRAIRAFISADQLKKADFFTFIKKNQDYLDNYRAAFFPLIPTFLAMNPDLTQTEGDALYSYLHSSIQRREIYLLNVFLPYSRKARELRIERIKSLFFAPLSTLYWFSSRLSYLPSLQKTRQTEEEEDALSLFMEKYLAVTDPSFMLPLVNQVLGTLLEDQLDILQNVLEKSDAFRADPSLPANETAADSLLALVAQNSHQSPTLQAEVKKRLNGKNFVLIFNSFLLGGILIEPEILKAYLDTEAPNSLNLLFGINRMEKNPHTDSPEYTRIKNSYLHAHILAGAL